MLRQSNTLLKAMQIQRPLTLALMRGLYGRMSRCFSLGVGVAFKRLQHAYTMRRVRRRLLKSQWHDRIEAAAVEHNCSYARLVGCTRRHLNAPYLNRKILSSLAMTEPVSFKVLCDTTTYYSCVNGRRQRFMKGL